MRTQGNLAGARDLLEPVADVAAIRLGTDDPDVIETMRRLATVYRELGELASARRVLEEALEGALLRLGEDEPVVLGISAELGAIADELGNRHEARKNLTRVARYGPGVYGPQHPYVRMAQRYLGADAPLAEPGPQAQASFAPPPAPPVPLVPVQPGVYRPPSPAEQEAGRHQAEPAPYEPGVYRPDAQAQAQAQAPPVPQVPINPFAGNEAPVPFSAPEPVESPSRFGSHEFELPDREESHRSRTPLIALGVVALVAVVAAVVVAVLAFGKPRSAPAAGPSAAAGVSGPSGGATHAASPSPSPGGAAPNDVKLRDDGDSVTLTWTDPSGGTVPYLIEAGKAGTQLGRYNALPPGQSTYTVIGLNPRLDYCFTVVAVYGTDLVAPSNLVCTQRTGSVGPSASR